MSIFRKLQQIRDVHNEDDPNYEKAKQALRKLAHQERSESKVRKLKRQRTPKVPAIHQTTGRKKRK